MSVMKEGWTYKKLGEVCVPKNTIERASIVFAPSDEIQYIDISSIDNISHKMTDVTKHVMSKAPSRAQQIVRKNDIVVSTVRPNLKNIALIDRCDDNLVASSGFCVLRVKKDVECNYIFYYVSSDLFTSHLMKLTTGANYPAVRDQDIRDSLIPIPPLPTQQSIVSELDKINELISLKKSQLKDLDTLAQSIFYEMFGDPITNDKRWEVKKLGDVCTEIKYGTSQPACDNGRYKYLRMCNLTYDGYLDLTDLKTINLPDNEIDKCIVKYGDILFNRTNSIELVGKTCMFDQDEPMVIAGYIIRVRLNQELLPVVLARMFNLPSTKRVLRSMAKGAVNQANINSKELASIVIPLPPLSLQHQFAERVESIERMKQQVQTAIKELETLLASRMQYWFE